MSGRMIWLFIWRGSRLKSSMYMLSPGCMMGTSLSPPPPPISSRDARVVLVSSWFCWIVLYFKFTLARALWGQQLCVCTFSSTWSSQICLTPLVSSLAVLILCMLSLLLATEKCWRSWQRDNCWRSGDVAPFPRPARASPTNHRPGPSARPIGGLGPSRTTNRRTGQGPLCLARGGICWDNHILEGFEEEWERSSVGWQRLEDGRRLRDVRHEYVN